MSTLPVRSAHPADGASPRWPGATPTPSRWLTALRTRARPPHLRRLPPWAAVADYLRTLRPWWWVAVAVFAIVMATAIGYAVLQPVRYTSATTVLVRTPSSAQLFPVGGGGIAERTMAVEAEFLDSSVFRIEARVAAGTDDPVEIDLDDGAGSAPSVIVFRASSTSAQDAATTARAWADTYLEMRHDIDVAEAQSTRWTLQATYDALIEERDRVMAPVHQLDDEVAAADPSVVADLADRRVATLAALSPQLQPIDAQLAAVSTELAELDLVSDLLANPELSARVNVEAGIPRSPTSPQTGLIVALAAIVGVVAAGAATMGAAALDDRLGTADEIERASGLNTLASVPPVRAGDRPVVDLEPGSPVDAAFRRLTSAIDLASAGQPYQVLLVTSPGRGEAKTATAARLSLALAAQGRRVLTIDADLEHASLSTAMGVVDGLGLADYLTDPDIDIERCLHRVASRERLVIMPAGTLRHGQSPSDAMMSGVWPEAIDELRQYCDYIVIDGPSLGADEAIDLATTADGVLVSIYARRSRGRSLQRSLHRLADARPGDVLGCVLTGVPTLTARSTT